ncbi:MAG: hypothetical protein PHE88_04905 [Elusimicrobia bacterium]|nr:hypothetical protein [Elusimicrobiota bacterium]
MKLIFLVFLIAITSFSIYVPDILKKTTGDIKQSIKSLKENNINLSQKEVDKEQIENLKSLQNELGFSAEKPMVEVEVVSPILDKFTDLSSAKAEDPVKNIKNTIDRFYLKIVNYIKSVFLKSGSDITFFGFIIILVTFVSKFTGIHRLASLMNRLGWFFSRFSLFIFSIAAIILRFLLKRNLWLDVGNDLFFIPLQILVASSLSFKIMDSNYPIWKRLFGSFILPIISGTITSAIHFL